MKQKICKLCSIMLTIVMILSTCVCAIGTVSAANVLTYYVSATGSDTDNNGIAYEMPLKTVAKAIELANDSGYAAGDTVNIKVLYNATSNAQWGTGMEDYTFTLNVSSADVAKATLGTGDAVKLTGPCVFDNINLYLTGDKTFNLNGKDVKFVNKAQFSGKYDIAVYDSYGTYSGPDINLYLGSDGISPVFLSGNYKNHTMDCNYNITVDNNSVNDIRIGNNNGTDIPTYKKNINFNIKNATKLNVKLKINEDDDVAICSFAPGSAIQFINSAGIELYESIDLISYYCLDTDGNNIPYYVLNTDSELKDAIKFTDTAGKFDISAIDTEKYNVFVKKDGVIVLRDLTTEIDLTSEDFGSGEYTVEAREKSGASVTYYVSPNGYDYNDGLTSDTAVDSVAQAIALANMSEYGENDTVYIKTAYDSSANNVWGTDVESHTFTAHILSSGDKNVNVGTGDAIQLTGPCVFDNVSLYVTGSAMVNFNANDVKFINGAKVTGSYYVGAYDTNDTYSSDKDINIYLGSDFTSETPNMLYLAGSNKSHTMDADINVTVDNNDGNKIILGNYNGSGTGKPIYNKNINVKIKECGGTFTLGAYRQGTVKTCVGFGPDAAVQLINAAGTNLASTRTCIIDEMYAESGPFDYYILNVSSDIKDSINFTDTAGVFDISKIDTDRYNVVVTKDGSVVLRNLTTEIDLTQQGSGEYTIELRDKQLGASTTYYVSHLGSDSNSGKTYATPLKTIKKAAQLALDAYYGANDTVNVKVIAGGINDFGDVSLPSHDYTLKISSATKDRATIYNASHFSGGFNGPIEFENIKVSTKPSINNYMVTKSYDITVGPNTLFENYDVLFMGSGEWIKDFNINLIGGNLGTMHTLAGRNSSAANVYENVNVVVDNNLTNDFRIGDHGANTGVRAKYYKNINFNIKNAASVTITTGKYQFVPGAAVQIINSAGLDLSAIKTTISGYTDTSSNELPYYILNVKDSNLKDKIQFTATAGKFEIKGLNTLKYNVIVKKDDTVVAENITDEIDLTASGKGEYTVLLKDKIIGTNATYYVSASGDDSNSGLSHQNPLKTVAKAVALANDAEFGTGDTINVKLLFNASTNNDWGSSIENHDFTLKISSLDSQAVLGTGGAVTLTGPTVLDNVNLYVANSLEFDFHGNDVKLINNTIFSGSVDVTGYNAYGTYTNENDSDFYIGSNFFGNNDNTIYLSGNYKNHKLNTNFNITVDNNATTHIYFGNHNGTDIPTYNKNININIKKSGTFLAGSYKYNNGTPCVAFGDDAAIQIINTAAVDLTATKTKINDYGAAAPDYFIINNKTGKNDILSFTDIAGEFGIDILSLRYQGYTAYITNVATNETTIIDSDTFTLEKGEYDFDIKRETKGYTLNLESGKTVAEGIQSIIDAGYTYGDDVVLNLTEDTYLGTIPAYNFNLTVKSQSTTRFKITVDAYSALLANNAGFTTHFKNVEIYQRKNDYCFAGLANSNVIFDSDVLLSGGTYNTMGFGYANDNSTVSSKQTVEFNCATPRYITLGGQSGGNKVFKNDVNLIINHKSAGSEIFFNAYSGSSHSGVTTYSRNININVKDAKWITLDSKLASDYNGDGVPIELFGKLQIAMDADTTISQDNILNLIFTQFSLDKVIYVVDKTFQRRSINFTDKAGTFAIDNDYEVTATKVKEYDYDIAFKQSTNETVEENKDGKIVLPKSGNLAIWEFTTEYYFEDFADTSREELSKDWFFSTDSSNYANKQEFVELTESEKLKFLSINNAKEIYAVNTNNNLKSKDQYISLDIDVANFDYTNSMMLLGRTGGKYQYESYCFQISGATIKLFKYDGVTTSAGFFTTNVDGFETKGLMEYLPTLGETNNHDYNTEHTYRMSLSIVTDYDASGNEVALVRGVILDKTSNTLIFDETFRDNKPYQGTGCGFYSKCDQKLAEISLDNMYFSSKKLRDTDAGYKVGDINGDDVYDVRDLVYTGENKNKSAATLDKNVLYRVDNNTDGLITDQDIFTVREAVLNDKPLTDFNEFNYSGYTDELAETRRNSILTSASADYGSGTTYYVSKSDGNYSNSGTSSSSPWTIEKLIDKMSSISSGSKVLFKRGDVFRLSPSYYSSNAGSSSETYSFLKMPSGTTFGAYGDSTAAKPELNSSSYNYSNRTWTKVDTQVDGNGEKNVWVLDAPEVIIDMDKDGFRRGTSGVYAVDNGPVNVIFTTADGREKAGVRKAYPKNDSGTPINIAKEKLYTLYKDGDYAYDTSTGKLYLYSTVNPTIYSDIELFHGIIGISLASGGSGFTIDNLNLRGFGLHGIQGGYGNSNVKVNNCEIAYAGGAASRWERNGVTDVSRYGNGVELWNPANTSYNNGLSVQNCWIHQTWDSAVTPQGSANITYGGWIVKNNLFEYNNCDIEFFDNGSGGAQWTDNIWHNNIMRFSTLGVGSRHIYRIRNIQGTVRGLFKYASKVDIDWTNNIIDTPGMEVFRTFNLTKYSGGAYTGIFKFGKSYTSSGSVGTSLLGNNTYYYNPYVRTSDLAVWDYYTMLPSEWSSKYGATSEEEDRHFVRSAADLYNTMTVIDNPSLTSSGYNAPKIYYLGKQVTSGS